VTTVWAVLGALATAFWTVETTVWTGELEPPLELVGCVDGWELPPEDEEPLALGADDPVEAPAPEVGCELGCGEAWLGEPPSVGRELSTGVETPLLLPT
jgi:hypothetical protein